MCCSGRYCCWCCDNAKYNCKRSAEEPLITMPFWFPFISRKVRGHLHFGFCYVSVCVVCRRFVRRFVLLSSPTFLRKFCGTSLVAHTVQHQHIVAGTNADKRAIGNHITSRIAQFVSCSLSTGTFRFRADRIYRIGHQQSLNVSCVGNYVQFQIALYMQNAMRRRPQIPKVKTDKRKMGREITKLDEIVSNHGRWAMSMRCVCVHVYGTASVFRMRTLWSFALSTISMLPLPPSPPPTIADDDILFLNNLWVQQSLFAVSFALLQHTKWNQRKQKKMNLSDVFCTTQ